MTKTHRDGLFLLTGLSPEEKAERWRQAEPTVSTYAKGETIYDSRLARPALAMVLEGTVRVCHGRVVMNTLLPGQVFGAAALFGEGEEYPSRVMAAQECRVLFITQEAVARWIREDPVIGMNYITFLSDRIRFLNRRLGQLTAGQTDDKLWRYLTSRRQPDGTADIPGGMTALAQTLGMGRSSLYRSLDALEQEGRIRRDGKKIIII